MRSTPVLLLALTAALAACAPTVVNTTTPAPRVTSGVVAGEAGFYPASSGLSWTYLPEGDPVTSPAYTVRIEGPAVLEGRTLTAVSFAGRGRNLVYYRSYAPDGVKLFARVAPDIVTETYEPPIQEYPAADQMRVGASWGGDTTIKQTLATTGRSTNTTLSYRYRVLAEEDFRVGGTTYHAYLINFTGSIPGTPTVNETFRFMPRVGEVRTREGLVLVARNF